MMEVTALLPYVFVSVVFFNLKRIVRFYKLLTNSIPGPSLRDCLALTKVDSVTHLWKITEEYGYKPWRFWLYSTYGVFVSDADTLEEIFQNKDLAEKAKIYYDDFVLYVGRSLMSSSGPENKIHRKFINPAFKKTLLEANHLPCINKEAANIVQLIRQEAENDSIDVHRMLEERICDVSTVVLIPGMPAYPDSRKYSRAIKSALGRIQLRVTNPVYYWLVYRWSKRAKEFERSMAAATQDFREFFHDAKAVVSARMRESVNWEPSNVFELMLQHQMEVGEEEFTDEDFFAECRILVAGSFDPVAFMVSVIMMILALHPDVQERVFEEQESIFGRSGRDVEREDLSGMVFLEMVIKETLRLIPPGPFTIRFAKRDTSLNGAFLAQGSCVFLNIMAVHRNPEYFKDPLKFDPDRFLPENSKDRPPCAFIPFSVGARACVGQAQAMLFLKSLLSHILRNFHISPGDNLKTMEDIKPKVCALMTLQYYPSLRFINRNFQD